MKLSLLMFADYTLDAVTGYRKFGERKLRLAFVFFNEKFT